MSREEKRQNYIEALLKYPGIDYDEIKGYALEELEELHEELQHEEYFEEDDCGLKD